MSLLAVSLARYRIQLQEQVTQLEDNVATLAREHVFVIEGPPIGEHFKEELLKAFGFLENWKEKLTQRGLLLRFQHVSTFSLLIAF